MKNKTIAFISALCLGFTGVSGAPAYLEASAVIWENMDTLKSVTIDRDELHVDETAQISAEWNDNFEAKSYGEYSSSRTVISAIVSI